MLEGTVHPDFWSVARVLSKQLPRRGEGGAAACVYHRGEKVVDLWAGTRDAQGRPWQDDTVSLSYSTTKGVASTLLHVYADRGLIEYDAPVAAYWPEFAQCGKGGITVRQILSHQAGLYDIRALIDHGRRMLDWDFMTEALAGATPLHRPGHGPGYHGLTFGWLVGELVQRVSGRSFTEALEAELAKPLELDGLFIGLPEDQMHRRAHLIEGRLGAGGASLSHARRVGRAVNGFLRMARIPIDLSHAARALVPNGIQEVDFNSPELVRASIPAVNGMFTARSLAKLYAMLANGGELQGVRLLSASTVRMASTVQTRRLDRVVPFPLHWRLGYHRAVATGVRIPHGFGHAGFGGSGGWACPDRKLSVALTLNHGVGTPFGDARLVRIGTAAARCADRR